MPEYLQRRGQLDVDEQRRSVLRTLTMWGSQIYTLLWLRLLSRTRRPFSLAADFLVPMSVLFVVWFGADMSPLVNSPAYFYNESEVRNIISPIPVLMQMPPPPSQYYNQNASSIYTSLNQASDFYDDLTDDTAFTKAFLPAITSADASRLSSLIFSDSALAAPLQVPSFDGYIKLMNLAREHVARQGLKDAAHISGFIWQIMNRPYGKITFSPDTPQVDFIVRHLLTTSTSFSKYLVPRTTTSMKTGEGFGFSSEGAANNAVPNTDDSHVWAHITIHSASAPSASTVNLEYTIAMNETDVPQPIKHMNQFGGIGASFSQYYFSGFLTLQHEIQEAITMAAQQVASLSNIYNPNSVFPGGRLDPLALAMATCNQALNDTFPDMNPLFLGQIHYPTPTDSDQTAAVDGLINTIASPWITTPVPVMQYASNLPCLFEAYSSCPTEYLAFDADPTNETSAVLATCIRAASFPSYACSYAKDFISYRGGHCFVNAQNSCRNMTEAAFLTGTQRGPAGATNAFQTCMINGLDPDCDAQKFGQMIRFQTQYSNLCADEISMWCQNSNDQFECLRTKWATNPTSNFPSLLCQTTVIDATKCVDDIKALCFASWGIHSPMRDFPFECLHMNVNLLSQSCFDSDLIQQYTEVILGRNATISTPTRAQQTCRVANTLNTAIRTGITAVSFPSDDANANSFFRNCGPLIGLVIALSFMYPFTTLTRHIAEERERGQKAYLLLAGANHSSILMSHLLTGLATMFILSLICSFPIEIFAKYTPTHIVFGLTFSYCFSLVGLSMFIAACVNTSRTATIVAPIVLFATTIPAFIIFGDLDGLDILFTPSTAAESFNILVSLSDSPHIPIYAATVLFDNGGIMFGMGLVYIVSAMIIEYIRLSTYSFGCLGRLIGVIRGHLDGSQKIVFKNFKNSKIYHSLNRSDYTGTRGHVQAADQLDDQDTDELSTNNHFRDAQDLEADLAEEQLALEERSLTGSMPNPHRTPRTAYSIGGVGESGASTNGSDSTNNFEQTRSESGGVKRFVQLKNASVVQTGLHGAHSILRNVTCTFFKNRANVIVGPSASGKSSILDIIGGRIAPTAGSCDIDDSKGSVYNRSNIGIALQSNIYWDVLSVKEHIEFIQNMKGVYNYETKTKELRVLSETLELDLDNRAELIHLSSGLQRRLAVAMAFAGGGKLILLDEPTASVDPVGRRCIWKLIHQNTEDRCIIIATSQAEEAEKADHLVLLHRGELKATGTPRFVKEVLGGATILSLSRGAHCQPSQLLTVVSTYCPHSKLINNVGQEICFRIDPADFHSIPLVLTELEAEMGKNSVKGISIADSRFDELFMKVIREFDAKGKTVPGSDGKPIIDNDDMSNPNTPTTTSDRYAFLSEDASPSSLPGGGSGAAGTSSSVPKPGTTATVDMGGGGRGGRGGGRGGRHRAAALSEHPMEVDALLFRQADAIGTLDEYNGRLRGYKLHVRNLFTIWSRYVAGSSYRFIVSMLTFVIPLFAVAVALNIMNISHVRPSPILLSPSNLYMYNNVPLSYNNLSVPFVTSAFDFDWKMNHPQDDSSTHRVTHLTPRSSGAVQTSHYLKDTAFSHGDRNRYGALVLNNTFLSIDNGGSRIPIYNDFLMHNTSSPHAMPSMHTLLGMIRMQQRTHIPNIRILASSAPFLSGVTSSTVSIDIIHTLGAVLILVPFTFLPAILVGRIIRERHSGYLDMISASYLSRSTVWTGAFLWQFFYLMLFSVLSLCLIVFSDQDLVVGGVEVIGMFFLMAFYCGCALSSSYVFALPFKNHITAQNVVTMFHFTAGFTFVIAVNAVDMLPVSPDTESAKRAAGRSANVLRVFFPSFAFGDALVRVTRSKANRFLPAEIGVADSTTGGLKEMGYHPGMHDVGIAIACLALTGMAYAAFLLIYDDFYLIAVRHAYNTIMNDAYQLLYNNLWRQCANRTYNSFLWDTTDLAEQEPSVAAERAKVADYGIDEGVVLDNVWQRYVGNGNRDAVYAVQRANLIIAEGDRIAVVGNNGSGKTSLLDMIAARVNPAYGRIRYWNANRRQCAELGDVYNFYARSYTGYAGGEQECGLPDDLTPYFLMNMVADARGLKLPLEREAHIAHLLHTLGILQVGLTRCGYLSPIIKRRVTIAMALVGFPPVVILDEPTSCMDPVGRRQIWAAINLLPTRCALVVSTQHHEDVEMLSNRVVLMDHGNMRLIASTKDNNLVSSVDSPFLDALPSTNSTRAQQARKRVISLTVTMNMPRPSSHSEEEDFTAKNEVVEHVFNTFPGATVTEDREGRELKFQLNAVEVRRDDQLESGKVKKWGAKDEAGAATEEETAEVSDERAAVIAARAGPPGVSVRDVFEKMHQKRTEMMIMGIKGAPLSGRPSPTSREEPSTTTVVGDSTTTARGKFPMPSTTTPKTGTRSDPDLPDGDAYPFEMKVSCSAHQQLLSDSLIPLKPGQIGNNNEVQVVERRIENMSCKVPIRDAPTLH